MSYVVVPLRLYLTVLLALIALVGDVLVSQSKIHTFQAIFDNVTHCMIGGLSWLLVCTYCKKLNYGVMIEVAVCAVIASLIDLDHFAMARSFSLQVKVCFEIIFHVLNCFRMQQILKEDLHFIVQHFRCFCVFFSY